MEVLWDGEDQATDDLVQDTVVMIVDPQLPRAHWPVGKVVKLNASADGCIWSAEVQVGDKTYLRPVARLVRLPAVPDAAADPGISVAPQGIYFVYIIAMLFRGQLL